MKILFLDIDGVCNNQPFRIAADRDGRAIVRVGPDENGEHQWDGAAHIDPYAVGLLNRVLDETGAVVVLSSSWRILFGVEGTLKALRAKGFTGDIIDKTGKTTGSGRHVEIKRWLEARHIKPDAFAVVDDDSDAGYGLERHFVKTNDAIGLTPEHADRLIAILGRRSEAA